MGKVLRGLRHLWTIIGHVSTFSWLYPHIPGAAYFGPLVISGLVGVLAFIDNRPLYEVIVYALASAGVSLILLWLGAVLWQQGRRRQPHDRFDDLLKQMVQGEPPSARKKTSSGPASGEAPDACSSDIQTPPDTGDEREGGSPENPCNAPTA